MGKVPTGGAGGTPPVAREPLMGQTSSISDAVHRRGGWMNRPVTAQIADPHEELYQMNEARSSVCLADPCSKVSFQRRSHRYHGIN